MKAKKVIQSNPKTTLLTIITVITTVWNQLSENAEFLGMSSKTIMIGSIVLTTLTIAYNSFVGGELPTDDDEKKSE